MEGSRIWTPYSLTVCWCVYSLYPGLQCSRVGHLQPGCRPCQGLCCRDLPGESWTVCNIYQVRVGLGAISTRWEWDSVQCLPGESGTVCNIYQVRVGQCAISTRWEWDSVQYLPGESGTLFNINSSNDVRKIKFNFYFLIFLDEQPQGLPLCGTPLQGSAIDSILQCTTLLGRIYYSVQHLIIHSRLELYYTFSRAEIFLRLRKNKQLFNVLQERRISI